MERFVLADSLQYQVLPFRTHVHSPGLDSVAVLSNGIDLVRGFFAIAFLL
jgi:hypothetical protein